MGRLASSADLSAAVECLVAAEPRFAAVVARHGLPGLRREEPGLRSLLRIVTDQLISLRAGEAIWARLEARLPSCDPAEVMACPDIELRRLGLSGGKARTFHAAAHAFQAGGLGQLEHHEAPEHEMRRLLLDIPGIGPWTANIYLLTVCGLADCWPAADLALQRAAMDLLGLPARPSPREMELLAQPWRPHRSAAALLLWSHYRGLKQMPQV